MLVHKTSRLVAQSFLCTLTPFNNNARRTGQCILGAHPHLRTLRSRRPLHTPTCTHTHIPRHMTRGFDCMASTCHLLASPMRYCTCLRVSVRHACDASQSQHRELLLGHAGTSFRCVWVCRACTCAHGSAHVRNARTPTIIHRSAQACAISVSVNHLMLSSLPPALPPSLPN